MTLAEALENLELEPGRTYRCRVRGLEVVLQVGPSTSDSVRPDPLHEDDIMLDPWTELPSPKPMWIVKAVPGGRLMPDPPYIPSDDE